MGTLTALFLSVSLQLGLPPNLLSSLCYVESKHKVSTIHYADGDSNSVGICQVKLKTAQFMGFRGTEKELMNPKVNIYYAGKYLKHQLLRYGQINKAVIAYNQGHAGDLLQTEYQVKVFAIWRK